MIFNSVTCPFQIFGKLKSEAGRNVYLTYSAANAFSAVFIEGMATPLRAAYLKCKSIAWRHLKENLKTVTALIHSSTTNLSVSLKISLSYVGLHPARHVTPSPASEFGGPATHPRTSPPHFCLTKAWTGSKTGGKSKKGKTTTIWTVQNNTTRKSEGKTIETKYK